MNELALDEQWLDSCWFGFWIWLLFCLFALGGPTIQLTNKSYTEAFYYINACPKLGLFLASVS